jgi:hypothetical protein
MGNMESPVAKPIRWKAFALETWRWLRWMLLPFPVLLVFRMLYGYLSPEAVQMAYGPDLGAVSQSVDGSDGYFFSTRKNYASEKWGGKKYDPPAPPAANQQPGASDKQKYEKVARLQAETRTFPEDEKKVRQLVVQFEGVIQQEHRLGVKVGNRSIFFAIGIPPQRFDTFLVLAQKIGKPFLLDVTKTDKTTEYRTLLARRQTLEKTRAALVELKNKGGRIEEYIQLENQIKAAEDSLQTLGVALGDFDAELEFCTVRYKLTEDPQNEKTGISFLHRLKRAIEWTTEIYLQLAGILLLLTVAIRVGLSAWIVTQRLHL